MLTKLLREVQVAAKLGGGQLEGNPRLKSAVQAAKAIRYWGHFPVADMAYETDAPVRVSLRAWSPFIPDKKRSQHNDAYLCMRLQSADAVDHLNTSLLHFPGPIDVSLFIEAGL